MIHCLTPLKTQSINNQQAEAILRNRRASYAHAFEPQAFVRRNPPSKRATNKSSSDKEATKQPSRVYIFKKTRNETFRPRIGPRL